MEFGLHPGIIFGLAIALFLVLHVGLRWPLPLSLVVVPLFVVGMFVGLSGVAVLSGGVFAVPALRRLGYEDATIAAFIAVMATAGMIAPPMNVPAILIASGVNMPWTNVAKALLALSVPLALAALAWFRWGCGPAKPSAAAVAAGADISVAASLRGLVPLAVIVAIWVSVRVFPDVLI